MGCLGHWKFTVAEVYSGRGEAGRCANAYWEHGN